MAQEEHVKERDAKKDALLNGTLQQAISEFLEVDHNIQSLEGQKMCEARSDLIISGVKSLADRIAATRRDSPVSKPDERTTRS